MSKRSENKKKQERELLTLITKEEQEPLTRKRVYEVPHYGVYRRLADELKLPPSEVKDIVSLITESILKELMEGKTVSLYNFGRFKLKTLRAQIKTSFGRCRTFVPETTIVTFRTAEAVRFKFNRTRPIKLTKWQLWENEESFVIYDDSETFKYSKEYKPRPL